MTWEQRMLCPDGGCVGVIGDDGLCRTCGRAAPNWGDERARGLEATARADDQAAAEAAAEDEPEDEDLDEDQSPDTDGGTAWGERALCSNGACVGVIGDDGACKVCGARGAA